MLLKNWMGAIAVVSLLVLTGLGASGAGAQVVGDGTAISVGDATTRSAVDESKLAKKLSKTQKSAFTDLYQQVHGVSPTTGELRGFVFEYLNTRYVWVASLDPELWMPAGKYQSYPGVILSAFNPSFEDSKVRVQGLFGSAHLFEHDIIAYSGQTRLLVKSNFVSDRQVAGLPAARYDRKLGNGRLKKATYSSV